MSVQRVTEKHASRDGPTTEAGGKKRATRMFVVIVTSPHDDGSVVQRATGIPRVNQSYSVGNNAVSGLVVTSVVPRQIDQLVWEVTVEYSTQARQSSDISQDPGQAAEDPLDRAPVRSYSGGEIETFPWRDLDKKVFQNSAGQLLQNSPSITLGYEIITIARNEEDYDRVLYPPYNGAVNSDKAFGYPPGFAKMERISAQEQYENFSFFRVTYEIHGLPADGPDWNAITGDVLDQGDYYVVEGLDNEFRRTVTRVYPTDQDEDKVVSTVHLNGIGGLLPEARVKAGDGVFLNFRVLRKKPFARLNIE